MAVQITKPNEKEVVNMKKWFKNFLKRLAESNKKNFGSQRLDCCDLNKKGSNTKMQK